MTERARRQSAQRCFHCQIVGNYALPVGPTDQLGGTVTCEKSIAPVTLGGLLYELSWYDAYRDCVARTPFREQQVLRFAQHDKFLKPSNKLSASVTEN